MPQKAYQQFKMRAKGSQITAGEVFYISGTVSGNQIGSFVIPPGVLVYNTADSKMYHGTSGDVATLTNA
jgi:hypothetical protein